MTACPMCRAAVPTRDLDELFDMPGMTDHARAVLGAVWEAKGRAITSTELFDAMYVDDPDGGPSVTRCYSDLRQAAKVLDDALAGSGVAVAQIAQRKSGGRWRLRIEAE